MISDADETTLAQKSAAPRVSKSRIDELRNRVEVHTTTCQSPTPHVLAMAWLDGSFYLGQAISKAVDPLNFDEEIGIKFATRDALAAAESKLWELEGYVLYRKSQDPRKKAINAEERFHALMNLVCVRYLPGHEPTPHVIAEAWLDEAFHLGVSVTTSVDPANICTEEGMKIAGGALWSATEQKIRELDAYEQYQKSAEVKNGE